MANIYLHDKGHTIQCSRDGLRALWHIVVILPDGTYGYEGWWRDSAGRTASEAVEEAKRGAQLDDSLFKNVQL